MLHPLYSRLETHKIGTRRFYGLWRVDGSCEVYDGELAFYGAYRDFGSFVSMFARDGLSLRLSEPRSDIRSGLPLVHA